MDAQTTHAWLFDINQYAAPSWVEVLVDCPGVQKSYTYALPQDMAVQPGDIVNVPFGSQVTSGVVLQLLPQLPPSLEPRQVRSLLGIVAQGWFPPHFWPLLQRTASYYGCGLTEVLRTALPPGMLARSQRRVRVIPDRRDIQQIPGASEAAQCIWQRLQYQKDSNYSVQYLKTQIKQAARGLRELLQGGWVESYLELPQPAQPKRRLAVSLVGDPRSPQLSPRQRDILQVLQQWGGELWLPMLIEQAKTSHGTIQRLVNKNFVAIEAREVLRLEQGLAQPRDTPKVLTAHQQHALEQLQGLSSYASVLLHGVTGSGKTEVYLQAIAPHLAQGRSALVLVPEIGLTPQLTDRFRARFGDRVCVYHSGLSDGERYDTWRQMLTGQPQIVIGTRSAVFAPLPKLGIIILDEEHDASFKQSRPAPTYHARQVAQWLAQLQDCLLILGSATPSLETWVALHLNQHQSAPEPSSSPMTGVALSPALSAELGNVSEGIGTSRASANAEQSTNIYLSLPERIQARPLPPVEIIDMRRELQRGNRSIFSTTLRQAIAEMQQQHRQGILFIARRGHSTFVSCRSCGEVLTCPDCDVSLSYHYTHEGASQHLRCHYCNYQRLHPRHCPSCGSPYLKRFGSGTQRVVLELQQQFPKLRCLRFDSDTTRTKDAHRKLLGQFAQGQADLLVGTQMLAKGLDIAQVTLVGAIAADGLLNRADYRASEQAFQTLTQLAGRAGRGQEPGRVIIQTYTPEHPVLLAASRHDYEKFAQAELSQRQALGYPPYGRLILLRISGKEEAQVQQSADRLAIACGEKFQAEAEILGPAPAPILRVAQRYRWHILLKFPLALKISLSKYLSDLAELRSLCPATVSLSVNVDPLGLD